MRKFIIFLGLYFSTSSFGAITDGSSLIALVPVFSPDSGRWFGYTFTYCRLPEKVPTDCRPLLYFQGKPRIWSDLSVVDRFNPRTIIDKRVAGWDREITGVIAEFDALIGRKNRVIADITKLDKEWDPAGIESVFTAGSGAEFFNQSFLAFAEKSGLKVPRASSSWELLVRPRYLGFATRWEQVASVFENSVHDKVVKVDRLGPEVFFLKTTLGGELAPEAAQLFPWELEDTYGYNFNEAAAVNFIRSELMALTSKLKGLAETLVEKKRLQKNLGILRSLVIKDGVYTFERFPNKFLFEISAHFEDDSSTLKGLTIVEKGVQSNESRRIQLKCAQGGGVSDSFVSNAGISRFVSSWKCNGTAPSRIELKNGIGTEVAEDSPFAVDIEKNGLSVIIRNVPLGDYTHANLRAVWIR